ncbi:MAG: (2E,6E)-farnesyl diphosphate synthase [Microgenomates bacterium OLB23]|nr:MAG: (2E,6E)-farnesyl diphosphate synthase [Microgenomates bacterium OLB23]
MQLTAVGQMMDFNFSHTAQEPTEEEILNMYVYKTAHYTLVNPFVMGAQAAGANSQYCDNLTTAAQTLGVIFQIRDDVMGLLGDEKVTGKTAYSDVRENKKTLIRHYLFSEANNEDKTLLNAVFGNKQIALEDFQKLLTFVKTSGVEEKINKKLTLMAATARDSIKKLSLNEPYNTIIEELVHYSLTRVK